MSNLIYASPDNIRPNRDRNKNIETFTVLTNPKISENLLYFLQEIYSDFTGPEGEIFSIKKMLKQIDKDLYPLEIKYLDNLLKQNVTHILT